MYYETEKNDHGLRYNPLKACVVPRPIGWITSVPSRLVRPPRVKGSPVHFECRLHQFVRLPGRKPSSEHDLVIGRVIAVHIDDAALTEGRVDVIKMRPIARLGYKDYISVDAVFQMDKRTPEDRIKP